MIRSALMKSVLDVLASHPYLAVEDFVVEEYQNKDKAPCLSLRYRYDQSLHFNFLIPHSQRKLKNDDYDLYYWFNCTLSPGRESATETINAKERTGVLAEIKDWMARLYEDIVAAPVVRQFDAHSSALDELREKLDQLPNEPLSRDDVKEYREGLERIKAEFSEQLKRAVGDKDELKQKIDEMNRDIEFLKQSLESMTGRQWGEILVVRLRKWKDKFSLKQIAAGARVFRKLLPENVSPELDAVANAVDGIAEIIEKTPDLK